MPSIKKRINQISRPKILMNTAKKLVQSHPNKMYRTMNNAELQSLINAESQYEDLRKKKSWDYNAEEHIRMLAKLIAQSILLSKKGLFN